MKSYWRIGVVVLLTLVAAALLLTLTKTPLFSVTAFEKPIINFYASYELSTIIISLIFLIILYNLAHRQHLAFLSVGDIDAPIGPAPLVGIKPKGGEGWGTYGVTIGAIITIVTGVVVYAQVAVGSGLQFRAFPEILLVLLFALMNSFTEEVIFRLSFTTIVANARANPSIAEFLSAAVFGGVHYFGIAPAGPAGALMAAFIGWFLAKSINETKGFFWAWVLHFVQDVVILSFLFMKA